MSEPGLKQMTLMSQIILAIQQSSSIIVQTTNDETDKADRTNHLRNPKICFNHSSDN